MATVTIGNYTKQSAIYRMFLISSLKKKITKESDMKMATTNRREKRGILTAKAVHLSKNGIVRDQT